MTSNGLKGKRMKWRFFAMLLVVVLMFQNTALSAYAADGTPGEGTTTTTEGDAGESGIESSGAGNTSTDGTGTENGNENGQTPGSAGTDSNANGQTPPGTEIPSNNGGSQPDENTIVPGKGTPAQPGDVIYPNSNDNIVMPDENNNPDASGALTDDIVTDGEDDLTIEEETESFEALNENADLVPAETQLRLGIYGAGTFSAAVKASAGFDASMWVYTYTVPEDTTISALIETLSSFVVPWGNIGGFDRFSLFSSETGEWLYGTNAVQYAVLNGTSETLYAQFYGNVEVTVASSSGQTSNTWRISDESPLTLTASMTVWDPAQSAYVPAEGVRFGEWHPVESVPGQDMPFSISWNKGTPNRATITATPGRNGMGAFNIPVFADDGSPYTTVSVKTVTVIVGNVDIPQDTSIPLYITGPGVFTNKAKNSSGFKPEDRVLEYVTPRQMSCAELLTELQQYVAPAGNYGKFSYWMDNHHNEITDTNAFDYTSITAHFEDKPSSVTTNLPDPYSRTLTLYDNSAPFTLTATLKLLNDNYQPVSTAVTGVRFGEWHFRDGDTHSESIISIQQIKPGQVKITPEAVGSATLCLPLVVVDGTHTTTLWWYEYTVVVKPASQRDYTIMISGPGEFTEAALNDTENYNDNYKTYHYTTSEFTDYKTLLSDLSAYVRPAGNLASSDNITWGRWINTGTRPTFQAITSDAMVPDGATIYAQFQTKSLGWDLRDNNNENVSPFIIDLGIGQEPAQYKLNVMLPAEDFAPVTGVNIEWTCPHATLPDGTFYTYSYDELLTFEGSPDNPSVLYLNPQSPGTVLLEPLLVSSSGNIILGGPIITVNIGRGLSYEAYDTRGNRIDHFSHHNPQSVPASRESLTLTNAVNTADHIFEGWYRSYDSETHVFSDPVSQLNLKDIGSATLYAKYIPLIHLEYKAYDSENNEIETFYHSNPVSVSSTTAEVALSDATYTSDYNFAGWYRDSAFTDSLLKQDGLYTLSLMDIMEGPVTLYAKFERIIPAEHITVKNAVTDEELTDTIYLVKGDSGALNLSAAVFPGNANQNVEWTSSDKTVAEVRANKLSGYKAGSATITVRSKDFPNIRKSFTVMVVDEIVEPVKIEISYKLNGKQYTPSIKDNVYELGLTDNGSIIQLQLTAVVKGSTGKNATYQDITWTLTDQTPTDESISLDENVLTIRPESYCRYAEVTATSKHDPSISSKFWIDVFKYYKLSFVNSKGTVIGARTIAEGDWITLTDAELKTLNTKVEAKSAGYQFKGWWISNDDEEELFCEGDIELQEASDGTLYLDYMYDCDVVLTAKWEPIEYSITPVYGCIGKDNVFVDHTSTVAPSDRSDIIKYTVESANTTLPNLSVDGYDFLGWYADENYTSKITKPIPASTKANKTVYAQLKKSVESISLEIEGTQADDIIVMTTENEIPPVSAKIIPSDADYDVVYKSSNPAIASVNDEGSVTSYKKTGDVVITATAGGKSASYTVRVIAGDGSNIVAPKKVTIAPTSGYKDLFDATSDRLAQIQYTATVTGDGDARATVQDVVWSVTDPEGNATPYATISPTGLVKLNLTNLGPNPEKLIVKATSKANQQITSEPDLNNKNILSVVRHYKLSFESVKNTRNVPAARNMKYNDSVTDVEKDPERDGYVFAGWMIKSGDGTITQLGGNDENFKMPASNTTLVAQWSPKQIKHVFRYVKSSENTPIQTEFRLPVPYAAKPALQTGFPALQSGEIIHVSVSGNTEYYRHLGWFTNETLTKAFNANAAVTATDDTKEITLYEKAERVYPIHFDLNGGEGSIPEQYKKDGEKATKPADPIRPGYVFVGWYASEEMAKAAGKEGVVNFNAKLSGLVDNNTTYYAGWAEKTIESTVTLIAAEYTNRFGTFRIGISGETTLTIPYNGIVDPEITAEGYELEGWYTDKARTKRFNENTRFTKKQTLTLYAKWVPVTMHTVRFHRFDEESGSYGLLDEIQVEHGIPVPAALLPMYNPSSGGYLSMCKEHNTNTDYTLSAPVKGDLDLDLIYMGDQGVDNPFASEKMIILTNEWSGTAVLQDIDITLNAENYAWADAVKGKKISSYASKGLQMLDVVYTGGGTDNHRTISVPVFFATVTGISITPTITHATLYPGLQNTYTIKPLVNGKIPEMFTPAVQAEAFRFLNSRANSGDNYSGISTTGVNANTEISFAPDYHSAIQMMVLHKDPGVKAKTNVTVVCSVSQSYGKNLSASVKLTLLPILQSSYTPPDHFFDQASLLLDNTQATPFSSFSNHSEYRFGDRDVKNTPDNTHTLAITGSFWTNNASRTFTVSSSNAKVATVGSISWIDKKVPGNSLFRIPLTVKGVGTTTITLTPTGSNPQTQRFVLHIESCDSKLKTTAVTLSKLQDESLGGLVEVTPGYGDALSYPSIESVTPAGNINSKVKADADERKAWFQIECVEGNSGALKISIADNTDVSQIVNGVYTLKLKNHGDLIGGDLKVTINEAVPKITIKQSAPLNLKKTVDGGAVTLTISDPVINGQSHAVTNATVIGSNGVLSPYIAHGTFDAGTRTITVSKTPERSVKVTAKSNKVITLALQVEGYRSVIRQTYTLNVVDKLPTVKLDNAAPVFYEELGLTGYIPTLFVDGVECDWLNEFDGIDLEPALKKYFSATWEETTTGDRYIRIERNDVAGAKTTSAKLLLSHPDYEVPLGAPLTITMQKASAFKPSLSTATISLNRAYPSDIAQVILKSNATEAAVIETVAFRNGSGMTAEKMQKLDIQHIVGTDVLVVKWVDPNDTLPNGNYRINVDVTYENNPKTYTLTLTVNVVNSASVTIRQSGTLKKEATRQYTTLVVTSTLTGINGEIVSLACGGKNGDLFTTWREYPGSFRFTDANSWDLIVPGYAYDVTIASAIVRIYATDGSYDDVTVPVNKKLTVKYN